MSVEGGPRGERRGFEIRTVHVPNEPPRCIGAGDFGTVDRAHVVTELLREGDTGAWQVEFARLHSDGFVTKTFHREHAVEDARRSVERYEALKAAGVRHLPGTHRISDSDPRVVISTFLGEGKLLITRNSVPEEGKRPAAFNGAHFDAMLGALADDLQKMSARGIRLGHEDALFFEMEMDGSTATSVDFTFGDFDTIEIASDGEKNILTENVTQATRALFWLLMSMRVIPSDVPEGDNRIPIANRIQNWADALGIDSYKLYNEYVNELEGIIERQRSADANE